MNVVVRRFDCNLQLPAVCGQDSAEAHETQKLRNTTFDALELEKQDLVLGATADALQENTTLQEFEVTTVAVISAHTKH